ncbi:hypothetical protein [Saccharopolyspora elongata]|uniref:hypothetical protein n=1 Tax=Saccharopolyspora elongata TaxID=2530387 RepID=UPI0014047F49|nr:hypothetical protein [Saccharopolyspora elongata]
MAKSVFRHVEQRIRRAWETDPEQSGYRAQARPNNLAAAAEKSVVAFAASWNATPRVAGSVLAERTREQFCRRSLKVVLAHIR